MIYILLFLFRLCTQCHLQMLSSWAVQMKNKKQNTSSLCQSNYCTFILFFKKSFSMKSFVAESKSILKCQTIKVSWCFEHCFTLFYKMSIQPRFTQYNIFIYIHKICILSSNNKFCGVKQMWYFTCFVVAPIGNNHGTSRWSKFF